MFFVHEPVNITLGHDFERTTTPQLPPIVLLRERKMTNTDNQQLTAGKSGRIVIGCVAENTPKYLSQALRLLQSVRWFGGTMAKVDFIVCIVDEVDPEYKAEFERLEALVRIVPRFSPVHPQSNKLRFFELLELAAYDTIIFLDCDTIIVQDPSMYLDGAVMQARIAGYPTVPHTIFKELFSFFGLSLPAQQYQCSVSGEPTIWYSNAGVLIVPAGILKTFFPVWRKFTIALCQNIDLLQDARNFCEQASLTLAFVAEPVPFKALPLAMNCPVPSDDAILDLKVRECDPVIIHYHNQIDHAGLVICNSNPFASERINTFNERVMQERRQRFNNRQFWDFRYAENPELGSGLGSREASLEYKKEVVRQILNKINPSSILDIGCGDQYVTTEIPDDAYVGIDLSPVIIALNRQKYPNRRYIAADFLVEDLPRFDMTICFDVVIHLDNKEVYSAFVDKAVRCARSCGIISGYENPPEISSAITFFHEPISQTLKWAGANNLRNLGTYRDTDVWFFTTLEVEQVIG